MDFTIIVDIDTGYSGKDSYMDSFVYYTPTTVFFGNDAESNIGSFLSSKGFSKVMIHYGSERVRNSGLLDKVVSQLDSVGIDHIEFGGVEPNPKIGLVRKGVELCKSNGVDFILGIGGGSVCDSSKAMALSLASGKDAWDIIMDGTILDHPFPMGIVLTMAAAGSEMSNSCVITNDEFHLKRSSNQNANRPLVAFMNPQNTLTVPMFQTAAGSVDMMMHTMERYLTDEPPTPLTDALATGLLRDVVVQTDKLIEDPKDLDARGELMWASSLAHNGLTGCGRNMTFTAHKIEHDLSGFRDSITHGAGLAVVFPAICLHEYRYGLDRFYSWARDVWGEDAGDCPTDSQKERAILDAIDAMKQKYTSWGMPSTLGELGVDPEDYDTIIAMTTDGGQKKIPAFGRQIGADEIREIYELAR